MSEDLLNSRYWRWYVANATDDPKWDPKLRSAALSELVASVEAGEITTIDGVVSPMSRAIAELHGLDSFEMNSNWIGSAQDWVCPGCGRGKVAVSRVGPAGKILAKLVIHHDHMDEALEQAFGRAFSTAGTVVPQVDGKRLVERIGDAFAAFEDVLVCEDCNNADTAARKLIEDAPHFSFSVGQITGFIRPSPHRPHLIGETEVRSAWAAAKPAYELRMRIVRAVAKAAATDSHWFEAYDRRKDPVPVFGARKRRSSDASIAAWVSGEALVSSLGPVKGKVPLNMSRWRTDTPTAVIAIPANYVAQICSEESQAKSWDGVPDGWHCSICAREKHETVYVSGKKKVLFSAPTNRGVGPWASASRICRDCDWIVMRLKAEAFDLIGDQARDSYTFTSPAEIAAIVTARKNGPHVVKAEAAEALLRAIVARKGRAP